MKKIFILFLLSFFNSFYSYVCAYEVEYNGLKYRIDTKTMSAIVIKGDKEYSGNIKIPNEIVYNGRSLPVTEIAGKAFKGCKLTSLTIPPSVKKLNSQEGDIYVDEFIIQDGQEALTYYNGFKFYVKSVYIGRSISFFYTQSSISIPMFYGPTIEKVVFGNMVKYYAYHLFKNGIIKSIEFGKKMVFNKNLCESVKFECPILLPEGVKELPEYGLGLFNKMPSIILPNSLETIPYSAFNGANANDIKLGNNTKKIGEQAFSSNDITYIEIPSTIEKIGAGSFSGCQKLKNVYIGSKDPANIVVETKYEPFGDKTYIDGTLYVPKGTINLYKKHKTFSKFFNIKEYDGTSIDNEKATENIISINNQVLSLKGFPPNSHVKLLNVDGKIINTYETPVEGCLNINLSSINKGIYIVKINDKTYKFMY